MIFTLVQVGDLRTACFDEEKGQYGMDQTGPCRERQVRRKAKAHAGVLAVTFADACRMLCKQSL